MTQPEWQTNVEWWTQRLDNVRRVGDGWTARCPAHDDAKNSLHINERDGTVLVHDFAGCSTEQILEAIENGPSIFIPESLKQKFAEQVPLDDEEARSWWAGYTGIEWEEWVAWGVGVDHGYITFTFGDGPIVKRRKAGSKVFDWVPAGASRPLWPQAIDVGEEIWITEGETDAGVLRHLGLPAYAATKGANTPLSAVFHELALEGLKRIVFFGDADEAGAKAVQKWADQAREQGLRTLTPDLVTSGVVSPSLGEKDLRDAWLRVTSQSTAGAEEEMAGVINRATSSKKQLTVDQATFRRKYQGHDQFLIPQWLPEASIGFVFGPEGVWKTWLALSMAIEVSTGKGLLGSRPEFMQRQVPTIFVPTEDSFRIINDRIAIIRGAYSEKVDAGYRIGFETVPEGLLFIHDERAFDLGSIEWIERLEDEILDRGAKLVVIDPLFAAMGADQMKDYMAEVAVGRLARDIKSIRDRTGCAFLMVHHVSNSGNPWGSVFLRALREYRIDLSLVKGFPTSVEVCRYNKSSGYIPPVMLTFNFNPFGIVEGVLQNAKGEDSTDKPLEGNQLIVAKALMGEEAGLTIDEIIRLTGLTKQQVRYAINPLVAKGRVENVNEEPPVDGDGSGPARTKSGKTARYALVRVGDEGQHLLEDD